jgi:hypothetical protein
MTWPSGPLARSWGEGEGEGQRCGAIVCCAAHPVVSRARQERADKAHSQEEDFQG